MKILVFGDIHLAGDTARRMPRLADAGLVILSGDLTSCGGQGSGRGWKTAGWSDRCSASG